MDLTHFHFSGSYLKSRHCYIVTDFIPVCTLSPICRSDIMANFPFSRKTLPEDGKQPPPPDGAGVVVIVGT